MLQTKVTTYNQKSIHWTIWLEKDGSKHKGKERVERLFVRTEGQLSLALHLVQLLSHLLCILSISILLGQVVFNFAECFEVDLKDGQESDRIFSQEDLDSVNPALDVRHCEGFALDGIVGVRVIICRPAAEAATHFRFLEVLFCRRQFLCQTKTEHWWGSAICQKRIPPLMKFSFVIFNLQKKIKQQRLLAIIDRNSQHFGCKLFFGTCLALNNPKHFFPRYLNTFGLGLNHSEVICKLLIIRLSCIKIYRMICSEVLFLFLVGRSVTSESRLLIKNNSNNRFLKLTFEVSIRAHLRWPATTVGSRKFVSADSKWLKKQTKQKKIGIGVWLGLMVFRPMIIIIYMCK